MSIAEESLKKHYEWNGKIEVISRADINSREDLSLAYTPGVAEPCLAISEDVSKSFDLTRRSNLVAVITDGTAVLGLGDIGPEAGMPVMEGKCALFKTFADVDAYFYYRHSEPSTSTSLPLEKIIGNIFVRVGDRLRCRTAAGGGVPF